MSHDDEAEEHPLEAKRRFEQNVVSDGRLWVQRLRVSTKLVAASVSLTKLSSLSWQLLRNGALGTNFRNLCGEFSGVIQRPLRI